MKLKCVITGALFLSLMVSGCATTKDLPLAPEPPGIDLHQVMLEIEAGNRYLDNGDFENAQGSFQQIIDTYPELPAPHRCGLLTNAALASLQMGDGRRFKEYARQLEASATGLRPLPRNTQIVLAIIQVIDNRATSSKLWITQPVERAVRSALAAN